MSPARPQGRGQGPVQVEPMNNRRNRKMEWRSGDLFAIPASDSVSLLGQVIAHEPRAMNSVSICVFGLRVEDLAGVIPSALPDPVSVVLTTRELLDSGRWRVVGAMPVALPRSDWPFEALRPGFVGAKIIGAGLVEQFAAVYCGFLPRDTFARNPDYFDRLLRPGVDWPADTKGLGGVQR